MHLILELPGVTDQLLPPMAGISLSLCVLGGGTRYSSLSPSLFHRSLALSLCLALSGKSADIVSGDWTI